MPTPQPGIFNEGSRHHHFLEYAVDGDPLNVINGLADIRSLGVAPMNVVIAFGPDLWRRIAPSAAPPQLRPFEAAGSGERSAPATQRDLFIWLHGNDPADVLDSAMAAHAVLGDAARAALDLPGFVYRDSRDLIGFVDGTANPKADARCDAALIPDGQPGAGGAYVLSQKWVHDLAAFHALEDTEQERVVGRTKADDVELEGDAMPADSHVSRTDVHIDGIAQKIYRRSAPYGTAAEHGLYFLAFACAPERFQVQLDRMYGVAGDDLYDRLTDFSKAVTGSYWFAPDKATLDGL